MNIPALRPYQNDLLQEVRKAYRDGFKCPLVVASTGLGKTILFSFITHGASQRGNPVLLAAHRKEIIQQISMSLAKFGVEHQIIAPADRVRSIKIAHFRAFGRSFVSTYSVVMVGSVQTIVGRLGQVDSTVRRAGGRLLVVMDEGHHCVEDTQWGEVMDHCASHNALGLIVTASPERLDGRGLGRGHGGYADVMIEAPPMSWAMENGYLSPYRAFTTANPIDMTGVKLRMGEFNTAETEERADKPSITGDAIAHYRQHANGMRGVVFCVSIKHSQHVSEEFSAAGIPAVHIDGGTDDAVREQAIMDFADGKVLILTQVNLISEGFDLAAIAQKDVTIDCLIDLAPTNSLVNAMQRWGRVLRPYPGKVAVILDHSSNLQRHGLPEAEREWTLEGRKKRKRKAADNDNEPDVVVRTCPQCFAITKPVPVCPNCGHVHEVKERKVEEKEGELVELTTEDREAMRRQSMRAQGKAQTVEELMAALGYSRGRAEKIVLARREKEQLQEQARQLLTDWRARWNEPIRATFGVFTADIQQMKPKELRALIERVQMDDDARAGRGAGPVVSIQSAA